MDIKKAISLFEKSSYSKMKMPSKTIDVVIDSYANYNDGILLIPAHASILPGSYLYFVDKNGNIKKILPLEIAQSNNVGEVHKI